MPLMLLQRLSSYASRLSFRANLLSKQRYSNGRSLFRASGGAAGPSSGTASGVKDKVAHEAKKKGLKGLMEKYGWSALGVYLAISAIDLPLCFLAVHSLGEVTINVYINRVKKLVGYGKDEEELIQELTDRKQNRELKKANAEAQEEGLWERLKQSSLLTEFLVAYGIHKSLVFVRVPLTAAVTPGVVKILQRWGFNLGKFNSKFKPTYSSNKIRNKSGSPDDFQKSGNIPKSKSTGSQKIFDKFM